MPPLIAAVVIRLLNVCEQIIFQEIMPPSLLFFSLSFFYQNNIIFIFSFLKKPETSLQWFFKNYSLANKIIV